MTEETCTMHDDIRRELEQISSHLRVVQSGIAVSAAALQMQNCEHDEDVARVLMHCVGSRLDIQLERLAEVIALLPPSRPHARELPFEHSC